MRRLLLTLVVLFACKDKRPEAPPPPPPPRDGVTLIQPGNAPLQTLRYQLTKGTRTVSELVYDLETRNQDEPAPAATPALGSASGPAAPSAGSAEAANDHHVAKVAQGASVGGAQGKGKSKTKSDAEAKGAGDQAGSAAGPPNDGTGPAPTLIVTLETLVDEVLPDGSAKLRITVLGTRVRDREGSGVSAELIRTQAAAADGLVFTELLSPDGKISDARVDAAANVPAKAQARISELMQALGRVAMQLPAEPVGVGAVWRERKPLPEGGIQAITETTYTLTSLTGTVATYTGTGRSTSTPQTIVQDDIKVEVTNPRGHSETKGSIDLSRYAPSTTATSTFAAEMNIEAPKGSPGAGKSTVEVKVAIQIGPAEAPPASAPASPAAEPPPAATGSAGGAAGLQGAHNAP